MPIFRRIWSEHVPLADLAADATLLRALAARDVQVLCGVQPHQLDGALTVLDSAARHSLRVGLWPMLGDDKGRWLNPDNAVEFERWVDRLLTTVERSGRWMDTVVFDLEPPIDEVRRLTQGDLVGVRGWLGRPLDDTPHRRLLRRASGMGAEVLATAIPPALLDGRAGRGWCHALGTPLDLGYHRVSAMLYTSLFEGYSFGSLDRRAARVLLARFAREARARFGVRASVSLGAAGLGALGDERAYRDVNELADDVAISRREGVEDLALFDLAGVLARGAIEPWLDALVRTVPAEGPPETSRRAEALLATLAVSGVALDVVRSRSANG